MLDGKMYTLNPSSWDKNHIHGGTVGFDKKLWVGNIITNGVELFYSSPGNDGQFFKLPRYKWRFERHFLFLRCKPLLQGHVIIWPINLDIELPTFGIVYLKLIQTLRFSVGGRLNFVIENQNAFECLNG